MSTNENTCNVSRFEKSQRIIEKVLEDLSENYDQVGGEISNIRLTATNVYQVSVSQEERIDLLTYHVEVNSTCEVTILKKDVSAKAPWE